MRTVSAWFQRFGYAVVGDDLLAGAYPLDVQDVERLVAARMDIVYNLCEDVEYERGQRAEAEAALEAAGIEERRLPLEDYGGLAEDRLERAVTDVVGELEAGNRVYLHCRAGWQRSAAVAAGVIALREGVAVAEALERLRRRKPSAEPMDHQRADLLAWWAARAS